MIPTSLRFVVWMTLASALSIAITWVNLTAISGPALSRQERAREKNRELEDRFITLKVIADNLEEYRTQAARYAELRAAVATELPSSPELEQLETALKNLAAKAGLTLLVQAETPRDEGNGLVVHPLRLLTTGSYHSIAVFADAVSRTKRIVAMTGVRLETPRVKNGRMMVDARFSAETYALRAEGPGPSPDTGLEASAQPPEDDELSDGFYLYSPIGKRDPFVERSTSLTLGAGLPQLAGTECRSPADVVQSEADARLTEASRHELDDLQLVNTKTGTATPCAMLRDRNGRCHAVRIGDVLGLEWGRVQAIEMMSVTVVEKIEDASTGRVYPVYSRYESPKKLAAPDWFCRN